MLLIPKASLREVLSEAKRKALFFQRPLRRVVHHQFAKRNRQNALQHHHRTRHNARIVPASDLQNSVLAFGDVNRPLRLRDGGRGLDRRAEITGMPFVMPPVIPPL